MKIYLLLIPILILSGCTIDWSGEKDKKIEELEKQVKEITEKYWELLDTTRNLTLSWNICDIWLSECLSKNWGKVSLTENNFWSGLTLSQTDEVTMLSYSGKPIKTWTHSPPIEVPFIWDEACSIVWKWFEKLTPENQSNGKQSVWDALSENDKKNCMKEHLWENIKTEQRTSRFFEIIQTTYDTATIWVYDNETVNLQQMPTMWNLGISESESWVTVIIDTTYWDTNIKLLFDKSFLKLISKEEIQK